MAIRAIAYLRLLFSFSLLTLAINALGQEEQKRFESLLVRDGLVQSAVLDITSDQYGYVWFGTFGGLSRFDGSEFVNYFHDPADSTSLSNGTIWEIYDASDGNVWFGTSDGLNKFDWSTEQFVQYRHPELKGRRIDHIEEWSNDTLIVGTVFGVYFFSISHESFFQLPEFDAFNGQAVTLQLHGKKSVMIHAKSTLHLFTDHAIRTAAFPSVNALYSDSNDQIWVLTSSELYLLDRHLNTIKSRRIGTVYTPYSKILQHENRIYVLTDKIELYDLNGNFIESYSRNPKQAYTLLDRNLSDMYIGSDGIWWIGTMGYGVNKFDPNKPAFGLIGYQAGQKPSLTNSYVTSVITHDDKKVLVGTAESLDVFDLEKNTVISLYPQRINHLDYAEGRYWAASATTLFEIDINQGKLVDSIAVDRLGGVRAMQSFGDGIIWIASTTGLIKLHLASGDSKLFSPPTEPFIGRSSGDWLTCMQYINGELLIGTTVGFYAFNLETERLYPVDSSKLVFLKESFIKSMLMDKNGMLWIGTSGEGLYRWDPINDTMEHFTTKDGLPNNVIYGVLEDPVGFLWMSTNNGLSRFHYEQKKFINLDIGYGLQSNEFNTNAFHQSSNGKLYFGGVKGLNYFYPGSLENPIQPETHITGFYLSNQRVAPAKLGETSGGIMDVDTIVLSHHQNMVGFDFKCSNFTIPNLNQYAYFMENLEEDWNYVGNRRFANYSSLPPGDYVFKVMSANNNGLWDSSPAEIVIIIQPPYWQTIWFRILVLGVLIVSLSGLYRWRTESIRKNALRLQQLVTERTENLRQANRELKKTIEEKEQTQQQLIQSEKMAALGTLSAGVGHEINNPLNFIDQAVVGLEAELKKNRDEKNIETFLNIIRQGVARAAQIVKSLSHFSRSTPYLNEVCDIEAILDNCLLLLQTNLKTKADVVRDFQTHHATIMGNSGKLHQVFFNIISNAAQAIPKQGTITISTKLREEQLLVEISDTGEGIAPENLMKIFDPFFTTKDPGEGTGLGLSLAHTIINEHRGKIDVASTIGKGTTFFIIVPTNKP